MSYFASSFLIWRLCWSSSNQCGALCESAVTWSAITGTIATRKSATASTTSSATSSTARERRIPRRMKNSTGGLSPKARNSETTIRISTERAVRIRPKIHHDASAPVASQKPVRNGCSARAQPELAPIEGGAGGPTAWSA